MNRCNKGCWTCRIRHRKCDEAVPICSGCRDRRIDCHGYGPKPEWMEGQARLRAELIRINFRRTRKLQNARNHDADDTAHSNQYSPAENLLPNASTPQPSPASNGMTFRDMQLLMHYLDHIPALQFPY